MKYTLISLALLVLLASSINAQVAGQTNAKNDQDDIKDIVVSDENQEIDVKARDEVEIEIDNTKETSKAIAKLSTAELDAILGDFKSSLPDNHTKEALEGWHVAMQNRSRYFSTGARVLEQFHNELQIADIQISLICPPPPPIEDEAVDTCIKAKISGSEVAKAFAEIDGKQIEQSLWKKMADRTDTLVTALNHADLNEKVTGKDLIYDKDGGKAYASSAVKQKVQDGMDKMQILQNLGHKRFEVGEDATIRCMKTVKKPFEINLEAACWDAGVNKPYDNAMKKNWQKMEETIEKRFCALKMKVDGKNEEELCPKWGSFEVTSGLDEQQGKEKYTMSIKWQPNYVDVLHQLEIKTEDMGDEPLMLGMVGDTHRGTSGTGGNWNADSDKHIKAQIKTVSDAAEELGQPIGKKLED